MPIACKCEMMRGSGLGSRLFPWARCTIFAYRHRVPMLAPRWVQPRIGPLLKGGVALTSYHRQILLYGLFRDAGHVAGIRRWWMEVRAKQWPETTAQGELERLSRDQRQHVVYFAGPGEKLADLVSHRSILHERFTVGVRRRWVQLASALARPIALNVRCGHDFSPPPMAGLPFPSFTQTPLDWYVSMLREIRRVAGMPVPAVIVSDGTSEQLRKILGEPNVSLARPGCAASDLLILMRAQVLVANGQSSFSAWGAFLGRPITICHPKQDIRWFGDTETGTVHLCDGQREFNGRLQADITARLR